MNAEPPVAPGGGDGRIAPGELTSEQLGYALDGITVTWGFEAGPTGAGIGDVWIRAIHDDTSHGFHTINGDIACEWGRCPAVGRGTDAASD
jgi:hypothetical protein